MGLLPPERFLSLEIYFHSTNQTLQNSFLRISNAFSISTAPNGNIEHATKYSTRPTEVSTLPKATRSPTTNTTLITYVPLGASEHPK